MEGERGENGIEGLRSEWEGGIGWREDCASMRGEETVEWVGFIAVE